MDGSLHATFDAEFLPLFQRKWPVDVPDRGVVPDLSTRLVQQELILRSEDPQDRRVKDIALTDKGRKTLKDSFRARKGWLQELAQALSREEKEQIAAALKILIGKTNQLEAPTTPTR